MSFFQALDRRRHNGFGISAETGAPDQTGAGTFLAAALREVSYCEQTHGKNRERYPNVPNGCNLFLQRMSKRRTKKMKFAPPPAEPSATDWSEYEAQHRGRRLKLQEEAKARQKKRTPPPKPTPEDEWDAVIDEMNGRLG